MTWQRSDMELFELLAESEHERWALWQRHVHRTCIKRDDGSILIPAGTVARWERQISTPYSELSEEERNSDRRQVNRYWSLIRDGQSPYPLLVSDGN